MKYRPKPHQSPSWSINGACAVDIPNEPTRWDKFLAEQNIEDKDLATDPRVLKFLLKNAKTYFVPIEVLRMYGMDWEEL